MEEEKLFYFFFLSTSVKLCPRCNETTYQSSKILSVLSAPFKIEFDLQDYSSFYD